MSVRSNIFVILFFGCFCLLVLSSCGQNEEVTDELIQYYNEDRPKLEAERAETMDDSQSHLTYLENTDGKETSKEYLEKTMLPELASFIEKEKAIHLDHEEVQELHQLLIDADEFAYDTLQDKGLAYYQGDIERKELIDANEDLEEMYDTFFAHRDALMKKHSLVIEEKMNDKGSYDEVMIEK